MRWITLIASAAGLAALLLILLRTRGRPQMQAENPGEGWKPTDEVMQDRETGRTLRVWVDPKDGKRYTVADLR